MWLGKKVTGKQVKYGRWTKRSTPKTNGGMRELTAPIGTVRCRCCFCTGPLTLHSPCSKAGCHYCSASTPGWPAQADAAPSQRAYAVEVWQGLVQGFDTSLCHQLW